MTDNFKQIYKYLESRLPETSDGNCDRYYVIELMRRGKDNPTMPAANFHFKNYYIYSLKDFNKFQQDIRNICDIMRMRAYISVNYKSEKQVMLNTMAEFASRIALHNYRKPMSIFESCSGKYVDNKDNKYVIDIDDVESNSKKIGLTVEEYVNKICRIVNSCLNNDRKVPKEDEIANGIDATNGIYSLPYYQKGDEFSNVIDVIPTKTGVHLITYGFYREEFITMFNLTFHNQIKITIEDIKENHLTLLYENL